MTTTNWVEYVDKVLSEQSHTKKDAEWLKALRDLGLAEYESGINLEKFEKILNSLVVGDVITFITKKYSDWVMNFLALFQSDSCFELIEEWPVSMELINQLALTNSRVSRAYTLKCKIIDAPISKNPTVWWITRYLGVCFKKVIVKKT